MASDDLLDVSGLTVAFGAGEPVVDDVSLSLRRGRTLALVGESGSGKSVTALAIVRLLAPGAKIIGGRVEFQGQELTRADEATLRALRGARISMVFQEPMTSLNPLHRIEKQIGEILEWHGVGSREKRRARTLELLREVGLQDAERRLDAFPHELSGGQRQRVMIAMALANRPDLLIADEPTTALDVTIQAQILTLLRGLQAKYGMAILFITHDLGIVRRMADEVAVMRQGRIVESWSDRANLRRAPARLHQNVARRRTQRRRAARRRGRRGSPVRQGFEGLVPDQGRLLGPRDLLREGGRRRVADAAQGPDPGPGRRIRFGQDHHRPGAAAADPLERRRRLSRPESSTG